MQELSCLVIDDEPLAREIIERHIKDTPGLLCVQSLPNALEGMAYMEQNEVDLMFLDINMPKLSGLQLIHNMSKPPLTIFTTAYPEHALESYELDAVDYLLKPISLPRFIKAVNKAKARLEQKVVPTDKITLKSDKRVYRLDREELLYLEGLGDYVKVYTSTHAKPIIVQQTMKALLSLLGVGFMRVHKSYIVNTHCIAHLDGTELGLKSGEKLPVGYSYRKEVNAFMRMD